MSKETYDLSDLDAILAEFRGETAEPPKPKTERRSAPAESFETYSAEAEPKEESAAAQPPVEATVRFEPARPAEHSPLPRPQPQELVLPDGEDAEPPTEESKPRRGLKLLKRKKADQPSKEAAPAKSSKAAKPAKPPKEYRKRRIPGFFRALLSLIFFALSLAVLCLAVLYLHPASGTVSFSSADTKLRLSDKLDVYVNNAASDAFGDLAYIRKIYTLQESATVAPAPDPNGFGMTYDPADITALIQKASILLDGQKMTFDPSADFVPDEPIRYYLDDTIFVVAWKEYIEQRCCTFAEVKVAHGSQLRRKLAEDSYSSSVQLYASDMASASNAVVAMNGDFYAFRDLGITAYQRKLYRNNPAQVDSCFFTASGDMLFSRAGELMGEGEAERFIQENDVLFAVAFGPVLVDNGELQYCSAYPIGEINTEYSRSCIAMTGDLHYLLMTINHTPDARPRATINELARIIYSKNVWKAYTLDGGQTAEIIMMGGPINHVDFGVERAVSDIIYFATAIPEEVRS